MIPKKPAPHLMRGGYRFPACAKPWRRPISWMDASAGVGRSEKIMLHQEASVPGQKFYAPWTANVRTQKRSMEARMSSAFFVHVNGVGESLWCVMKSLIAASSAETLR